MGCLIRSAIVKPFFSDIAGTRTVIFVLKYYNWKPALSFNEVIYNSRLAHFLDSEGGITLNMIWMFIEVCFQSVLEPLVCLRKCQKELT